MSHDNYFVIIPAAGSGQRMQSQSPKQYLRLNSKPLLQHTLERLGQLDCVNEIIVAIAQDDQDFEALIPHLPPDVVSRISSVIGGNSRALSVLNALQALDDRAAASDWVLVHDAARPCITVSDVEKLINALRAEQAGGILAMPVRDTIKQVSSGDYVERTLDRSMLWQAATPQMFRYSVLLESLRTALAQGLEITDEASAIELAGYPVRLVHGRPDNIKITFPEDLVLAAAILQD